MPSLKHFVLGATALVALVLPTAAQTPPRSAVLGIGPNPTGTNALVTTQDGTGRALPFLSVNPTTHTLSHVGAGDPLTVLGRPLNIRAADRINVLDYATCQNGANGTDDTVGYRAAITAAIAQHKTLYQPASICRVTGTLTVNAPMPWVGDGRGRSIIRGDMTTGDIVDYMYPTPMAGGGFRGISVESGAGFYASLLSTGKSYFGLGTSGACIRIANINTGATIADFSATNCGSGVRFDGNWELDVHDWQIGWISGDALAIGTDPSYPPTGGNKFLNGVIQQGGYTGSLSSSIGVHEQSSGGNWFENIDNTGSNNAWVFNPPSGKQINYDFFSGVTGDTSISDAWVFDGSAGGIYSERGADVWGSYSGGSGLKTIGPNIHGLRIVNLTLRENANHGWNNLGGDGFDFVNPEIDSNGRGSTAGTYCGVSVADGTTALHSFSLLGGSIGNRESSFTAQGGALCFLGAAANFRVAGVDMTGATNGVPTVSGFDETKISGYQMSGNLPLATLGVNPSSRLTRPVSGFAAAGATTYFNPGGTNGNPNVTPWVADKAYSASRVWVYLSNPPGSGNTVTVRLVSNGSPVGTAGTITGSATVASFVPGIAIAANTTYELSVQTSSGFGAIVNGYIGLDP